MRIVTALALLASVPAFGNFLTYIDEKGTKHIVQSEDEIPEKYRKNVKQSAAGDPKNSFYNPDVPYSPDPKDSPRESCEKEADYNFTQVKKKLYTKEDVGLSPEELKDYQALVNRREKAKADCQHLSADPPGKAP